MIYNQLESICSLHLKRTVPFAMGVLSVLTLKIELPLTTYLKHQSTTLLSLLYVYFINLQCRLLKIPLFINTKLTIRSFFHIYLSRNQLFRSLTLVLKSKHHALTHAKFHFTTLMYVLHAYVI